jgi:LPS export ABC transporter protein LptC
MARLVLSRAFWLLLGAAAVATVLVGGWLTEEPTPPELPEAPPPRADYYLRDAEVDVMDDTGQLSYRLRTTELLRYSDHSSRMSQVQIDALGGQDGVWRLEAGEALITRDQEQLLLSGGVRMQTEGLRGPTQLTTKTLKVELKRKRMTTADPVAVTGPEFEAQAVGMQAAFQNRNLTLLNQVRTRYVP